MTERRAACLPFHLESTGRASHTDSQMLGVASVAREVGCPIALARFACAWAMSFMDSVMRATRLFMCRMCHSC